MSWASGWPRPGVAFDHALAETFGSDACRWMLLRGGDEPVELVGGRGSAALSAAADIAYPCTPVVGNEMLNRSELTSQGAKARRLLLEAMIERGSSDIADFGFEGYGPETAMYRSFLLRTGLHRVDARSAAMSFGPPADETLAPAWEVLEGEFRRSRDHRVRLSDIFAALRSPPIGMKAAVVPVLVTAGLLAFRDEVAIYEHGHVQAAAVAGGVGAHGAQSGPLRHQAFRQHQWRASGGRRGPGRAAGACRPPDREPPAAGGPTSSPSSAASSRGSTGWTTTPATTRAGGAGALAVRHAMTVAVEPDDLLFSALPEALGFGPVQADAPDCEHAGGFADAVGAALEELESCLDRLLAELLELLLDRSAANSRTTVMGEAAALGDEVLDPEVRAFVLALANEGAGSDSDWIAAIATVVARKAPAEWADEDRLRFRRELPERLAAFHRLVALHAERRAGGGGPFDALRVTVTRSDGSEYIRLVGIDAQKRPELEGTLESVLADLAPITGSAQRAEQSLLALLSERLLPAGGSVEPAVGTGAGVRRKAAGSGASEPARGLLREARNESAADGSAEPEIGTVTGAPGRAAGG